MHCSSPTSTSVPFRVALLWSAVSGTLALAWEICWSRMCSVASSSLAEAFGIMLGFYLLGLAGGALYSKRLQSNDASSVSLARVAKLVAAANFMAFITCPLAAWMITALPFSFFVTRFLTMVPIAVSGMLFGVVFPLLCHWAVSSGRYTGRNISFLYVANIIGSGVGSLLTGFVMMEHLGLATLTVVILVVGHIWAEFLAGWHLSWWVRIAVVTIAASTPWLFHDFYEKLYFKGNYVPGQSFKRLLESRHGVIGVTPEGMVIGNGVYDSIIHNGIHPTLNHMRPYLVSAVHANPREVLVVGVASGTWTNVIANHPQVEHVTAVEISGGYVDLIRGEPAVSALLTHPKVELIVDDGRRWMRNHPERKFDVLVMNTSFSWREFASNVLSVEFLTLAKRRLKPGGVALWNATGSRRATVSCLQVFADSVLFNSFCVGGAERIDLDWNRWERVLRTYQIAGKPSFDLTTKAGNDCLAEVLEFRNRHGEQKDGSVWRWLDRAQMEQLAAGETPITDDNLGEEYRKIQRGFMR